ncbi:hypothetical protein TRIUR3_06938 [Triticum urartu]|uniref:Uncharacterized protein n=1 Tax=Triticum urartu TaxID=4572 RepID=M7YUW5_TRIUA|nr:hypothetical protein TRIUR3_06938 [Triticum urartu]
MEGSPATRLPEADALPDGFVESSSADQAQPVSSAPAPAAADPLPPSRSVPPSSRGPPQT